MHAIFSGWQVLQQPDRGVSEVAAWRPLLERESSRNAVLMHTANWHPIHHTDTGTQRCNPDTTT